MCVFVCKYSEPSPMWTLGLKKAGFHTGYFGVEGKFVGHCHSVTHEFDYSNFQVFRGGVGGN